MSLENPNVVFSNADVKINMICTTSLELQDYTCAEFQSVRADGGLIVCMSGFNAMTVVASTMTALPAFIDTSRRKIKASVLHVTGACVLYNCDFEVEEFVCRSTVQLINCTGTITSLYCTGYSDESGTDTAIATLYTNLITDPSATIGETVANVTPPATPVITSPFALSAGFNFF